MIVMIWNGELVNGTIYSNKDKALEALKEAFKSDVVEVDGKELTLPELMEMANKFPVMVEDYKGQFAEFGDDEVSFSVVLDAKVV